MGCSYSREWRAVRPQLAPPGAVIDLNHSDRYFHWGFILISVANLVVIVVMLALFVAAVALPFLRSKDLPNPAAHGASHTDEAGPPRALPAGETTWTGGLRRVGLRFLPPSKLLPDTQPAYVASWVYVFGVATPAWSSS